MEAAAPSKSKAGGAAAEPRAGEAMPLLLGLLGPISTAEPGEARPPLLGLFACSGLLMVASPPKVGLFAPRTPLSRAACSGLLPTKACFSLLPPCCAGAKAPLPPPASLLMASARRARRRSSSRASRPAATAAIAREAPK